MTSQQVKMTSSEAIECWSMKIVGYVDSIEGLRELPRSNSKWVYKCILNNNDNRRERILFWTIVMYQILKIIGGVTKVADIKYRRSGDTVSGKEFQFGAASTLEVLGTFDVATGAHAPTPVVLTYRGMEMKDVSLARERMQISDWIKEVFRSISTTNGASYGSGMMCTDVHRMSVHVATFLPRPELTERKKISINGTIDRRGEAFVLNASTMDQISIVAEATDMTEDEMDEAGEAPPLIIRRESESGISDAKKPKLY